MHICIKDSGEYINPPEREFLYWLTFRLYDPAAAIVKQYHSYTTGWGIEKWNNNNGLKYIVLVCGGTHQLLYSLRDYHSYNENAFSFVCVSVLFVTTIGVLRREWFLVAWWWDMMGSILHAICIRTL